MVSLLSFSAGTAGLEASELSPRRTVDHRRGVTTESRLIQSIAASRPQPDEFYPKPPPTEPLPVAPTPVETPLPAVSPSVPTSMPEQPSDSEKPVTHPMPPPEVP
jgi:hypothetical protein